MEQKMIQQDGNAVRRGACWKTNATNPHSEYVIGVLTALLWQDWLRERCCMLLLYIHCLCCYNTDGVYCAVRSGTTDKIGYVSSWMYRPVQVALCCTVISVALCCIVISVALCCTVLSVALCCQHLFKCEIAGNQWNDRNCRLSENWAVEFGSWFKLQESFIFHKCTNKEQFGVFIDSPLIGTWKGFELNKQVTL
jgi:hypothetical protein